MPVVHTGENSLFNSGAGKSECPLVKKKIKSLCLYFVLHKPSPNGSKILAQDPNSKTTRGKAGKAPQSTEQDSSSLSSAPVVRELKSVIAQQDLLKVKAFIAKETIE